MTATETPREPLLAGMSVKRAILLLLAVQLGGWLVFDGARAFIVGDYVTPDSGRYAGELGPWSVLLEAIGIAARGTFARALHVVSGLVWLAAVLLELLGRDRRKLFLVTLPFGLWYLPFGTGIALACAIMAATGRRD